MASYALDDKATVRFRDSKGRYTTPTKAKTFYVYEGRKLLFSGEFPRIGMRVSEKEEIVFDQYFEYQVLGDVFESAEEALEELHEDFDYDDPFDVEDYELSELQEMEAQVGREEQLFDILLKEVEREDPDLAEELMIEYLSDQILRNLMEEEITDEIDNRFKERLPASIRTEEKEIMSSYLGRFQIEKIFYTFEKLLEWQEQDPELIFNFFEDQFGDALKVIWDEMVEGQNRQNFIFRLTFSRKKDKAMVPWGVGPSRLIAKSFDSFMSILRKTMMDQLQSRWANYVKEDKKVYLSGFTLEV